MIVSVITGDCILRLNSECASFKLIDAVKTFLAVITKTLFTLSKNVRSVYYESPSLLRLRSGPQKKQVAILIL